MKYEITKGSEKDFDGAPAWAVNALLEEGSDGDGVAWSEQFDYMCKAQYVGNGRVPFRITNPTKFKVIAERRPITELVWDGEGLPPVGVRVECFSGNEWRVCEVVFTGEPGSKTEALVFDVKTTKPFWIDQFRPIRSPEDVARSNAIGEMERAYEELTGNPAREAEEYYDLIVAGKIPGVLLESKAADLKINITTDEMWREFEKKSDMEDVRKLAMKRLSRGW